MMRMKSNMRNYPDVSRILAARAQRRRELAALSWEEKVMIIERMRASMPKGKWNTGSSDT
jgi:hypothetical protein